MAAKLYVGLDVAVETTTICVVDQNGAIVREGKVESTPEAIAAFLKAIAGRFVQVGLEAGTLPQWL
jgi:transposase